MRTQRKQKRERVEMRWQKHLPTAGEQFPTNAIQTTGGGGGGGGERGGERGGGVIIGENG